VNIRVIGFVAPIIGTKDEFNTFRLGSFYAKRLSPGDEVLLLDEKEKMVFGRARVQSIYAGGLDEMCAIHAHKNHTELANDSSTAPERLSEAIRKIYGPHIATIHKKTTVIYLKRIE
jgi:hypothetical protein